MLGLLVMYLPAYYSLATTLWNTDEQAHGPLILMVVLYLVWRQRRHLLAGAADGTRRLAGGIVLLFGLLLFVFGRSQDIMMFDIGSQIPVVIGILLLTRGVRAVKALWFPIFFIVFMIPLPGFAVDAVTAPLKQFVSELTEAVLYQAGYPIARSGVILTIGQYELLVADACSGMNSLFSLSAMCLLYLYLMRNASWLRNTIIVASIIPIAVFANIVRVIILVLVTYHFGDEAGQGFIHGFAGVLLFIISLLVLVALDGGLGWLAAARSKGSAR